MTSIRINIHNRTYLLRREEERIYCGSWFPIGKGVYIAEDEDVLFLTSHFIRRNGEKKKKIRAPFDFHSVFSGVDLPDKFILRVITIKGKRRKKKRTKKKETKNRNIKDRALIPSILHDSVIPPPLHSIAPRRLMPYDWWKKEREKAIAFSDGRCCACGRVKGEFTTITTDTPKLEQHEQYSYDSKNRISTYIRSVMLCTDCHACIHIARASIVNNPATHKRLLARRKSLGFKSKSFWDGSWNWKLKVEGRIFNGLTEEQHKEKYNHANTKDRKQDPNTRTSL